MIKIRVQGKKIQKNNPKYEKLSGCKYSKIYKGNINLGDFTQGVYANINANGDIIITFSKGAFKYMLEKYKQNIKILSKNTNLVEKLKLDISPFIIDMGELLEK